MRTKENKFCKIYNMFWGNCLTSPGQLKCHAMDGDELQEFCEFYLKESLNEYSLKHFYSKTNKAYIYQGILIGVLFAFLLVITLFSLLKF